MQSIHQLAFVLMNTLDLHVEQRVNRDLHTVLFLKIASQTTLVVLQGDTKFKTQSRKSFVP